MSEKGLNYHIPAMLEKSLDGLNLQPSGVYVDATFGGGGHSRGILSRLEPGGRLFAFDQDADTKMNIPEDNRFTFVLSNFRYLTNFMRYYKVSEIDGIIADLGVSSHHFDDETRGFSFRFDGKPDMRMNKRGGQTAADVLNTYTKEQLADVLHFYGELKPSRKIAAAIVAKRTEKPIDTVAELIETVLPFSPKEREKKYLAQVFQALRIEVNQEMAALQEFMRQCLKMLKRNGRLVVITYHSLEDRLVKNFMKTGNFEGDLVQDFFGNAQTPFRLIGKMTEPSMDEVVANPRVRSAKLRIAEKI